MRRRLAAATLVFTALACRPPDARETRDFERMRIQQRYDAFGQSRFFANGAVLQPPPAHALPRHAAYAPATPPRPVAFFTGRSDSAYTTATPLAVDATLREAGARQFAITCAPCHGAAGFGGGTIAPNLVTRRPPSLRSRRVDTLPDGRLFSIITNGFGRMPPYGWQMPAETRWAVVAYVRSLTSQPQTTLAKLDSSRAAALQRLDSLHASGASLRQVLKEISVP